MTETTPISTTAVIGPQPDSSPEQPTPEVYAFPTSFAQRRLWFLDQLDPGNGAYNIAAAVELRGVLEPAALARGLGEIVRRHEALRTGFEREGGEPVQIVVPDLEPALPTVDLGALPVPAAELQRWQAEEARRPFDLGRPPLLRATLFRLGREHHRLLLTLHHIVSDGWSMGVFVREMAALYTAFTGGRSSPLPELPIQYPDFTIWQREWLRGEVLEHHLGYWRRQLSGAPRILELATDRPRPPWRSLRGGLLETRLPAALSAAVRELGRRRGATPFMVLLTSFQALLHRWSGQREIVVGTPVAGRRRPELEGLIGLFVNTLALRVDHAGEPSFDRLLDRVREVAVGAFEHQDLPFERLVEELEPERSLSFNPLFQLLFGVQSNPVPAPALPGLETAVREADTGAAQFDLSLDFRQAAGGLAARWSYARDLFDATTVRRLDHHLRRLLASIVEAPDRPLSELPILGRAERHQLLREWAETAPLEAAPAATIHGLVDAAAGRRPDAVAVVDADGATSYRQLRDRARSLARRLRHLGVRAEDPVAVLARRSRHLPVALLAVLEAGASYLPLDPAYPPERLAFLLDDARATALLADGTDPPQAARHLPTLDLRDDAPTPEDRPLPPVDPGQLAYLIYTSGSTGRPKGVAIEHRSAAARLRWAARAFGPEELRAVLAATSVCFDLSVFELFAPLAAGGTVFLADDALDFPHRDFAHRVRLVNTVPSAIAELLRHDDLPDAVRTVNLAGEPLPAPLVEELYRRPGVRRVLNLYGPSEDTTYSTGARTQAGETPPIGRPLPGTAARVLDPRLRPLPTPVAGELHLGGAGLARGYLRRPARTAERFVPDPFAATPGARLYRTGDRVRQRADGTLEFLGRRDHQVKVRGFRIELGEVEAALDALEPVREAAVAVSADGGALVAYLVPAPGADPAGLPERCRRRLGERLPAYLVPAVYTVLERLPRTPNGKLDRAALPVATATVTATTGSAPPATPLGELVAGVWAEVLPAAGDAARRLGWDDDFFALGGHSLLATRVVARLRHLLGVEVPVRRLFERPTLRGFTELVAAARRRDSANPLPPIEPGSGGELAPLSYPQERLWFLDQLQPGEAAYVIAAALELRGPLRADWLLDALHRIVDRHAALRTTFEVDGELPRQRVHRRQPPSVARVDLAALPTAERRRQARRLARAEARRPFDLGRGPLVRLRLLRLAGDEHLAVLALHHVVADGWSLGVLLGELSELYTARAEGRPPALPALPVQYPDFARWQRRQLRGELLEKLTDYWRRALAGAPMTLELPTDRPRPTVRSYRAGSCELRLPPPLVDNLDATARRLGATPYMVLLGTFQLLLHRLCHQRDLLVGSPIANRDRVEVEGLIGLFVNTLVMRSELTRLDPGADPSWRRLLGRVRETTLEAYGHQEMPFERLVEELQPERQLSRSPVFQALFVFQNAPLEPPALPEIGSRLLPLDPGGAKFDLALALWPAEGSLAASLEVAADLFDPTTARRLLAYFRNLLAGALATPDRRLSELPLLDRAERHQLVHEWQGPPPVRDGSGGLHRLFELQAARTPEAVAVVAGERVLSYAELDRRADRLARQLRRRGVGSEDRVGVAIDRSPWLPVALLAVLKAGGAYVGLDPAYPRRRLELMVADARIGIVLAAGAAAGRAAALAGDGRSVLRVDRRWPEPAAGASGDPGTPAKVWDEQLAYLVYTSGSTGRPKAVAIPHRGARALVGWSRGVFGDDELAATLAVTSICFDLSVFELFVPLCRGGTVVLADDPLALAESPPGARITLINTVPSAISELLRLDAVPATVRTVNLAGEPLRAALAERIHRRTRATRLLNLYGPSEDTTYSTWARIDAGEAPSIGRPVDGTRATVLDRRGHPVPRGAVGELVLAGPGLARGYLLRPRQTAERFLPDPHPAAAGDRGYRTGDLVRHLPDGRLDFLGRIDHQVKVRGFRVELGEIEAALADHPAVAEAVAAVRPGGADGGDPALFAWVEPTEGAEPSGGELLDHLRRRLPAFMVPAVCQLLPELPRTANGKIDRRALPDPRLDAGTDFVAPRGDAEELVAAVWAEVLGRERLGANDDFFALGGHSLLATRVIARLRRLGGVDLPLKALFEAPTVAALARRLGELPRRPAPAIEPAPRREPLPLSFAQERLWFLDRWEPGSAAFNMPAFVALDGRLEVAPLRRALAAVVARHEVLRTRFEDDGGRPVQVVGTPFVPPLPVVDLRRLGAAGAGVAARGLAGEEARRPFDLARGPLLRGLLLRVAERRHHLLLTLHHAVSDGWSTGVLTRELAELYGAFAAGRPSPLPPLAVQYADFAVHQRRVLESGALEPQLDYWRRRLGGELPPPPLPTDRRRSPDAGYLGDRRSLTLPAAFSERLRALGARRGGTLFMVLLAAFKILLHRLGGESDVVVGTPISGRDHERLEGLVGCFLNNLALRTDLAAAGTFEEVLTRVRETTLGAYAHQEVPFERLLGELAPDRDPGRSPLFQVFFNLLNYPRQPLRLPDLTLSHLPAPEIGSKFDLTVYADDSAPALRFDFVYNARLFTGARIEELARQYRGLLEQIERRPDRPVNHLSLVTEPAARLLPDPRRRLDAGWPGAIHRAFLEQARRWPERTAVIDPDHLWSYRALVAESGRLARELRRAGIGAEDVVAIYAHRSAPLVAAVLGVLRAGAAFTLLDPDYPTARSAQYLRLARPRGWVRIAAAGPPPAELRATLDELGTRFRATLDGAPPAGEGDAPPVGPEPEVGPDHLACVTFTSGSTGVPKAVLGRHGGLACFYPWQGERFGLGAGDRYGALSALSHDPLQRDLFTPFWFGAALCLPEPDALGSAERLADWMRRQRVSVVHLTPAMGQLLTGGDGSTMPHLRLAFFVGEALLRGDVDRLVRRAPGVRCVNLYGATETQRAVGHHPIPAAYGGADRGEVIPLGRGVPGVQLLILSRGGRRAGIGELGEIHLRSRWLARSYGEPRPTAERFLPNPWSGSGDDRLYRTGDLGRYRPDGVAEFAGRADQQVKIRGFRIEPAEIEGLLARHPSVRRSAVVVRDDAPGGRGLVAYLVPAAGRGVDGEELRAFLARRLPSYMVPSAFVALEALPLTANRKLDRRALPAPELPAASPSSAPRDEIEALLAELWGELLDAGAVGVDQDFFALGGHSLLATQLVSRIRDRLGVELPLRELFERPTVAAAAARIRAALGDGGELHAEPIVPVPRTGTLPCSFAQRRLWFLDRFDPGSDAYNISTPLRLTGPLSPPVLERCCQEIVRRHEVLRTRFRPSGDEPLQEVMPWGPRPLPLVDLGGLPAERRQIELHRLLGDCHRAPFDLTRGPLWRLRLVRLAAAEHALLLTLHHVVTDRWSLGLLTRELFAHYHAIDRGERPRLPELPVQYADFAAWQRRRLDEATLRRMMADQVERLGAIEPRLYLDPDPRASEVGGRRRAGFHRFELDGAETAAVRTVAAGTGATLFMVTLAAFEVLLHHRSGRRTLVVGTDVANRNRREIEGLLGFFVNQLVLRTEVDEEMTFDHVVRRVRRTALEAYGGQDLPFERLVEALRPAHGDPSWSPFRVKVNLHNVPVAVPELERLRVELIDREVERSPQLDLIVNLVERGNRLAVTLEYDRGLFLETTMERFASQYHHLLGAVAERPAATVGELRRGLEEVDRRRERAEKRRLERFASSKLGRRRRRRERGSNPSEESPNKEKDR